jgi:hypothetical protein
MLDYSAGATSYNTSVAGQLQKLSSYLGFDVNSIIGNESK